MKRNILIGTAIFLLAVLNIAQFFIWKSNSNKKELAYVTELESLRATIDAHGGEVTCYTVASAVKPGDEITEESLVPVVKLASNINDQYVTDINSVIGKYFKIGLSNGTPVLTDMVMTEQIRDDMRDIDIFVDRWTVGLEVGDYVDINVTMPYGDDYYVISHKRIMGMGEGTLKLYLTAAEWETYQGALVDYYLNAEYGCTLYAQRYIEPGIQQDAVTFYTPPANIAALLQKNPNVIEKEALADMSSWRSSIEELLVIFRDEEDTVDSDGAKLAEGRANFNNTVKTDTVAKRDDDLASESEIIDDGWETTLPADGTTTTEITTDIESETDNAASEEVLE